MENVTLIGLLTAIIVALVVGLVAALITYFILWLISNVIHIDAPTLKSVSAAVGTLVALLSLLSYLT